MDAVAVEATEAAAKVLGTTAAKVAQAGTVATLAAAVAAAMVAPKAGAVETEKVVLAVAVRDAAKAVDMEVG